MAGSSHLDIREVSTNRVITAIEVLSPANQRPGEGRQKYLTKRQQVFKKSQTHLVEIDLLRKGQPMPIEEGVSGGVSDCYQP